ncbi:MAG: MotA/TolQ/ExbB proton channel family protein [Bacteriovoracaceae bacterium]|jgi:biopolymer transport protein ExbB/TolQ|nr:MotA/TolQ/ExbB proton channel family protein [Bacteriovoracaceae bacterium]
MSFLNILNDGGFIMYPLLFCSLTVWIVAIQKFFFMKNFKRQYLQITNKAYELIQDGKCHEAKGLCLTAHPYVSVPFLSVLEGKESGEDVWAARIERRLLETREGLKSSLWILGTIGSSAPFIGLFGTVVGIIKSFQSIAVAGKSGFAVVASGLSEALIATAAGILVAVIAVVFYNFFQTKLTAAILDFKIKLDDLGDLL